MNQSSLHSDLCLLLSSILGKPVNTESSRASEAAWDSLKHMEIIFAVESKWGVTLSEEEMASISSVADLHQRLTSSDAT
jgi:acyl carrier protein